LSRIRQIYVHTTGEAAFWKETGYHVEGTDSSPTNMGDERTTCPVPTIISIYHPQKNQKRLIFNQKLSGRVGRKLSGWMTVKEPLASARSRYCSELLSEAHGHSGHGVVDQTIWGFIRWTQIQRLLAKQRARSFLKEQIQSWSG
jgi:hypothetical protein